ncbi:hypothetical protein AB0L59_22735 [Streptomyces sp. NPDC052109]|uniref:hypothetical protein n=1 Tax=Streptomyces sp. NPDC052109 TaxID=3155527 RepID=UPI003418C4D0
MKDASPGAAEETIVVRTDIGVAVADEPPVRLPAELRYATTEPYAVCLSVGAPSAPPVDRASPALSAAAVTAFPRRTGALVPPGTEHEHIDPDGAVERLTTGSE